MMDLRRQAKALGTVFLQHMGPLARDVSVTTVSELMAPAPVNKVLPVEPSQELTLKEVEQSMDIFSTTEASATSQRKIVIARSLSQTSLCHLCQRILRWD